MTEFKAAFLKIRICATMIRSRTENEKVLKADSGI